MDKVSCGIVLYRRAPAGVEVLLAHPGGPFWAKKDGGVWSIPKGEAEAGEDLESAARREFEEETGIRPEGELRPLGSVRQKSGKVVHAWALEGDADASRITSNMIEIQWPPTSGKTMRIPEIDRCGWFDAAEARTRIVAAQGEFITRLEELLRKP